MHTDERVTCMQPVTHDSLISRFLPSLEPRCLPLALPTPTRLPTPYTHSTAAVMAIAEADPNILKWTEGKEIKKKIYVPGKICNIVVAG